MSSTSPPIRDRLAGELVAQYAAACHQAGSSAHRLEESTARVGLAMGMDVTVLALPTGMLLALGPEGPTRLVRHPPARCNLARLRDLYHFADQLNREKLEPVQAMQQLEEILARPAPYGTGARLLAYTLAGAAFSTFFDGGYIEALMGLAVGFFVGLFVVVLPGRFHRMERMPEMLAAMAATVVAGVIGRFLPGNDLIPIIAGLVLVLPGLNFTIGVAELVNRSQMAGTVRLASSAMTLISMVFGAALGYIVPILLGTQMDIDVHASASGLWLLPYGVPVAAYVTAVFMQAPPRLLLRIVGICALSVTVSRLGTKILPDWQAIFLASLAVGLVSNVYARITQGPASALMLPGIYMLVPGSVGMRSLIAMVSGEVQSGILMGFNVALRGIGLVAGMLVANLLIAPPAPSSRRADTARHLWHSERL